MTEINDYIHLSDYSEHSSIRILCTGEWDTPSYDKDCIVRKDFGLGGGIYKTNTFIYTFSEPCVTCPECIKIKLKEIDERIAFKLATLSNKTK